MTQWRPIAQFIILAIDLSCFGPIPGSISIKMGPEAHQVHFFLENSFQAINIVVEHYQTSSLFEQF